MEALLESLLQIVTAVWSLIVAVAVLLLPLLPLAAWVGFWLFAVDWEKLRRVMLNFGWIGVVLIALVVVLVWGTVSPPAEGYHRIGTLAVSNYVGKLVYVTGLVCIMLLCGAAQLAGFGARYVRLEEPEDEAAPHEHAHAPH
jgi:hypothetical protein